MKTLENGSKPIIYLCTSSSHSSMFLDIHKTGRTVDYSTSSLKELKELSERVVLKARFIGSNSMITAYKKLLDSYGINYIEIPNRIKLDPTRKDMLYVLYSETILEEGQEEFPDYAIINVLTYKVW